MIFLIFIFGLIIGSFLNVCIYRMPKEESIVMPASHCPECKTPIPWRDNIPVVSYILLRGKCRFCKKLISPRYIIVEILTAVLLAITYKVFGPHIKFFVYSILFGGLIVATFVDFKHQIIPDEITYSGMVLGLIFSAIWPALQKQHLWYMGLIKSILGLVIAGASIYVIGVIGKLIYKKDAMGGGDIKLMAMVGAFLGWKYALLVFFIAPFFGSVVGIIMKIKYKVEIIPYGPYLSLATVVVVFWGRNILGYLFF
ncbi:MAG: prepilin peptidase [Candidatus Omnitrophota bacterium]